MVHGGHFQLKGCSGQMRLEGGLVGRKKNRDVNQVCERESQCVRSRDPQQNLEGC